VIRELKIAKEILGYEYVQFEDEVFSYDNAWLSEFRDMYRNEINVPFECYIYPNANIEGQLTLLKEAGLNYTCLALQSGSDRINKEVFNRTFDKEHFINTANLLKGMGIAYYTDVITFNPFETKKDLQATLNVLNELPKPFHLCVNKLYALKGTKIFDMVENHRKSNDGITANNVFLYYARLFWLATHYNKRIVRLIETIRVFKYFPFLFNWLEYGNSKRGAVASFARRTFSTERLRKAVYRVLPNGTLRKKVVKAIYLLFFDRREFGNRLRRLM